MLWLCMHNTSHLLRPSTEGDGLKIRQSFCVRFRKICRCCNHAESIELLGHGRNEDNNLHVAQTNQKNTVVLEWPGRFSFSYNMSVDTSWLNECGSYMVAQVYPSSPTPTECVTASTAWGIRTGNLFEQITRIRSLRSLILVILNPRSMGNPQSWPFLD